MTDVSARLKLALATAIITAAVASTAALGAFNEGEYNCCGNSACDSLKSKQACPTGDGDCATTGFRSCCGDGEAEASCYASENN